MTKGLWRARVDVPGVTRGSGFLVSDRHVLTCAHVVKKHRKADVVLGDSPTPRRAEVVTSGPWWTETAEAADIAVLELTEAVTVGPARFGPHTSIDIYAGQDMTSYGFPEDFERSGVNATRFTASPHRMLGRNVQLDAKDDIGIWLQEGFSGAAAVHAGTGQVVGMIKAAGDEEHRIGVMVPIAELVRHVPMLDEVISLGPFGPRAYAELRSALRAASVPPAPVSRCLATLRAEVPGFPDHLDTVQAAAEALVVEVMSGYDDMSRRLAAFLWRLGATESRLWVADHLFDGEPPGAAAPETDGAVVVCLAPAADAGEEAYDLTVWTVQADGELTEPVVTGKGLVHEAWQERVESAINEAIDEMPIGVETITIEFVLPRAFLSEPVDEWIDHTDDDTPLGVSRPMVVRDLDWFRHRNPASLGRRARSLRDTGRSLGGALRGRDCRHEPGDPGVFKAWLREDQGPFVISLAGRWAAADYVRTAVAAGPPVLIWRRPPCSAEAHEGGNGCAGGRFAVELAEHLRAVTVDSVARAVRELRIQAAQATDAHCGNGITLLRDDTRRRIIPLAFAK